LCNYNNLLVAAVAEAAAGLFRCPPQIKKQLQFEGIDKLSYFFRNMAKIFVTLSCKATLEPRRCGDATRFVTKESTV